MLIAVLADIHGDLAALRAVMADAEANGAERLLVLGDIVGGGDESADCINALRDSDAIVVMGNHEAWALAPESVTNRHGGDVVSHFSTEHEKWLRSLPLIAWLGHTAAVHASFHRPERWTFISNAHAAERSFSNQPMAVAFAGHTHEAGYWMEGSPTLISPPASGELRIHFDRRYLINPGAAGLLSPTQTTANYILYDDSERVVRWRGVALPG